MALTAGYDVGGAHLKVALVADGRPVLVRQIACPLWRGVCELDSALAESAALTKNAQRHGVTMTGELADVFPDRYTGVAMLAERLTAALGTRTLFWAGQRGFVDAAAVMPHYEAAASTNFLATARIAARFAGDGLLVDIGSTTTDIIPLSAGTERASGLTDADRLRSGELVYTGLTRTPVMAVTAQGLYRGRWQGLARDPFATMADVRRVLGDLPDGVDQHTTADGRGKSAEESLARLARCFGHDVRPEESASWRAAAGAIAEAQLRSIHDGAMQVLSAVPVAEGARVITAGIGSAVAEALAQRLAMPATSFGALVQARPDCQDWATRCAPAVAVAMLVAA